MTYPRQASKEQRKQDRDAFERKVARIYSESDTWSEFKMKAAIANSWIFPPFSPFWHYHQHQNWKCVYIFAVNALWTIVWLIACFAVICLLAFTGLISCAFIAAPVYLTIFWLCRLLVFLD